MSENEIPTIKGRIEDTAWNDTNSNGGSGIGDFFKALGKGIKKVAQAGWDAIKIIGEHADELFPEHYSAYESHKPVYDDPFGSDEYLKSNVFGFSKNRTIMDKLANVDPLDDDDIKQLDLVSQLLKARADTESKRLAAQSFRTNALQAIIGNQMFYMPKQNNKVQYRGNWVDEKHAPYLVKSDIHSLIEKDRRMTLPEIKKWPKLNQSRMIQSKIAQNIPDNLYKEPGATDITVETIFDLYTGARLGKGLLSLSHKVIGSYAEKQASKRIITFSEKQIKSKYMRHAAQLGIKKNYTPANATQFAKILEKHIKAPTIKLIKGTYRGSIPVNIYYNSKTGLMVMTKRGSMASDEFISSWRLSKDQLNNLKRTRNVQ